MKLRSVFAALLCILLAASPAGSGSMMLLGVGKAGAGALPGPPVFTFTDMQGGSASTNTVSYTFAIGTANSNRRVYILVMEAATGGAGIANAASFNSGAIPNDVLQLVGTTATDTMNVYLVSAVIPAGTTATLLMTYPSTVFSAPRAGAYTVDTTTLSGINPVVTAQSVVTAATANPTSANTFGIATSTAGSAILAGFIGFGITNNTQSITSSDASLSNDGSFGAAMVGHANSVPVSASSHVNTGWTTSGDSILALVVFR